MLTFTKWLFAVLGMTCHNTQRINLEAVPMRERWDLLELPRLHPWSAARGARPLMWEFREWAICTVLIIRIGIFHLRVHEHGNRVAILFHHSASRWSLQLTFGAVLCFVLGWRFLFAFLMVSWF